MRRWLPVLALFLLAGCGPAPVGGEKEKPAPSAPIAKPLARSDAMYWATRYPDRRWSHVSDTGSMVPLMDSHSIALFVRYTGQPLRKGMVVTFNRGDLPNVCHQITEVRGDHVFISGLNVPRSDGWFHRSTVSMILAGLYFTDATE